MLFRNWQIAMCNFVKNLFILCFVRTVAWLVRSSINGRTKFIQGRTKFMHRKEKTLKIRIVEGGR